MNQAWVSRFPAARALRHRDFRLLWIGSFLSFTGSWVQNVAQGYLVYEMTGDPAKLALVTFAAMVPISVLGPFLGIFADLFNKRTLLIASMLVMAAGPLFLGFATALGFLQYWHIIVVALSNGLVMTIETPARQSIVRLVVTDEDLPAAIPAQALTFNLARIVGPAIGGILAGALGPQFCFFLNGLSYGGLVFAAIAIRTDLSPSAREPQPIRDLLTEGMLFTMREKTLKTLFLMEGATSIFGMFYLALMPAIAKTVLGLDQRGLGLALSCIGIGAVGGLLLVASLSHRPYKPLLTRLAMTSMSIALIALGFVRTPALAYPLFALIGASAITQFNSTNTLFQMIAPERLRGRVLSMHIWAISGLAPVGIILFGWLARELSIPATLWIGGGVLLLCAMWAWAVRGRVFEPTMTRLETTSGVAVGS